ncbi:hypothetical protein T439DRAFT_283163 [Meredithblackwellia eburnea MCA 4105]
MAGGGGGLVVSSGSKKGRRRRWVGRAGILDNWPHCPTSIRFIALALGMFGLQITWSCEMAQASPYLLSLGLSKSWMSIVFVAGPLSGLVVQPIVGVLSDSCKSKLGRRRPYMLAGCAVSSVATLLLGWSGDVAAWFTSESSTAHNRLTIALAVLAVYVIDFSINVVQAMDRSLLVDLVPPSQQPLANAWASRTFGFGAVFGYWFGGLDLVRLTRGWMGGTQLKAITAFTAFFLVLTHAVTAASVTERVLLEDDPLDHDGEGHGAGGIKDAGAGLWGELKEIGATLRTLPRPIQQVFNVQFASWMGWFPILFFSTTWVAEIYTRSLGFPEFATSPADVREEGTRIGTRAMFFHSLLALATSVVLPPLVAPMVPTPTDRQRDYLRSAQSSLSAQLPSFLRSFLRNLPHIPFSWLSLPLLWTISNGTFAILLLSSYFAKRSVAGASAIIAGTGFCWSVTNWAPFAIVSHLSVCVILRKY